MNATEQAGVRPEGSSRRYFEQAGERGRRAGAARAGESAEYLDLKRLAAIAVQRGLDDEQASVHKPAARFGRLCSEP